MPYKKRTGHIERGIRYAFVVKPDRAWSTTELMAVTHALPLCRSGAGQSGCVFGLAARLEVLAVQCYGGLETTLRGGGGEGERGVILKEKKNPGKGGVRGGGCRVAAAPQPRGE